MLRTAYLLTGNHHDAEDLVQSALVKVYLRWQRVLRTGNPDAYVWRVMVHANVDRLRRLKLPEWLTTRLPEKSTADRTEQVAERSALVQALMRLPARQRASVVLRYFEDLSETEVAGLLGVRVGTVRSQTARALAKLRQDETLRPLAEGRPQTATAVGCR